MIGSVRGSIPCGAIAAKHVGERDVCVRLRDSRRVEPDGRPARRRLDPAAGFDLRRRWQRRRRLRGPSGSVNSSPSAVQKNRPRGWRRLGDRVALHASAARRPRSGGTGARRGHATRLPRSSASCVHLAGPPPGWLVDSSPRSWASRSTPAAGREHDGPPAATSTAPRRSSDGRSPPSRSPRVEARRADVMLERLVTPQP